MSLPINNTKYDKSLKTQDLKASSSNQFNGALASAALKAEPNSNDESLIALEKSKKRKPVAKKTKSKQRVRLTTKKASPKTTSPAQEATQQEIVNTPQTEERKPVKLAPGTVRYGREGVTITDACPSDCMETAQTPPAAPTPEPVVIPPPPPAPPVIAAPEPVRPKIELSIGAGTGSRSGGLITTALANPTSNPTTPPSSPPVILSPPVRDEPRRGEGRNHNDNDNPRTHKGRLGEGRDDKGNYYRGNEGHNLNLTNKGNESRTDENNHAEHRNVSRPNTSVATTDCDTPNMSTPASTEHKLHENKGVRRDIERKNAGQETKRKDSRSHQNRDENNRSNGNTGRNRDKNTTGDTTNITPQNPVTNTTQAKTDAQALTPIAPVPIRVTNVQTNANLDVAIPVGDGTGKIVIGAKTGSFDINRGSGSSREGFSQLNVGASKDFALSNTTTLNTYFGAGQVFAGDASGGFATAAVEGRVNITGNSPTRVEPYIRTSVTASSTPIEPSGISGSAGVRARMPISEGLSLEGGLGYSIGAKTGTDATIGIKLGL